MRKQSFRTPVFRKNVDFGKSALAVFQHDKGCKFFVEQGYHYFALLTDAPMDRVAEEMLGVFERKLLAVLEETGNIYLDS